MASLLSGKFQLFHRNFSLMEKLQNETAMYTRLVYINTVGHGLLLATLSVLRVFAFFYLYFSIIMASAKRMRSNNYRKEEELLLLEEISKFNKAITVAFVIRNLSKKSRSS
jgi:hypothetical protein